jgi:hypothetical protein
MTRRTSTLVTAAALALATCVVQAADDLSRVPRGTVLEGSVETTTDQVLFPSSTFGQILAPACLNCAQKSLQLNAESVFNLAGKRVTLQEMAAYCGGTRSKPITIQYRLSDSIVSMVSVGEL